MEEIVLNTNRLTPLALGAAVLVLRASAAHAAIDDLVVLSFKGVPEPLQARTGETVRLRAEVSAIFRNALGTGRTVGRNKNIHVIYRDRREGPLTYEAGDSLGATRLGRELSGTEKKTVTIAAKMPDRPGTYFIYPCARQSRLEVGFKCGNAAQPLIVSDPRPDIQLGQLQVPQGRSRDGRYSVGDRVRFAVSVRNGGATRSAPGRLRLFRSEGPRADPGRGHVIRETRFPMLDAGRGTPISLDWVVPASRNPIHVFACAEPVGSSSPNDRPENRSDNNCSGNPVRFVVRAALAPRTQAGPAGLPGDRGRRPSGTSRGRPAPGQSAPQNGFSLAQHLRMDDLLVLSGLRHRPGARVQLKQQIRNRGPVDMSAENRVYFYRSAEGDVSAVDPTRPGTQQIARMDAPALSPAEGQLFQRAASVPSQPGRYLYYACVANRLTGVRRGGDFKCALGKVVEVAR